MCCICFTSREEYILTTTMSINKSNQILTSRGQTLFSRRSVIAFSISAPLEKVLEEFTVPKANRFCWALIDCT